MNLTSPTQLDRFHSLQRRALLADLRLTIDREGALHLRDGDKHDTLTSLEEADARITEAEDARHE